MLKSDELAEYNIGLLCAWFENGILLEHYHCWRAHLRNDPHSFRRAVAAPTKLVRGEPNETLIANYATATLTL
jgi:hypothetical protein